MQLPRSTPERQGISSERLLDFYREAAELNHELHSFMLVVNGHVIAESWWKPYEPALPHQMFSLSKSFTSTAVGMAVDAGLLSVDDPVTKFFPEEAEALGGRVDEKLSRMTVKNLLTMATGQTYEAWPEDSNVKRGFVRAFLSGHIKNEPGSVFLYNSNATFMLSAIVQKLTGQTLTEYLTPRLFKPLGITVPYWESTPEGVDFGGFGLNLMTEDIAKFGQLYLQKGNWQGRQLVSEEWVNSAVSKHIENSPEPKPDNDWAQGYGFQFWRCTHGAYRGDGAFGQFCVVIPEGNAVIAITSNADMQTTLNLIWKHLHPVLTAPDKTLAESAAASGCEAYHELLALREKLNVPEYGQSKPAEPPKDHPFTERPRLTYSLRMEDVNPDETYKKLSLEYSETRREMLLSLWVGEQARPFVFVYKPGEWTDSLSALPYGEHMARAKVLLEWPDAGHLNFISRYIQTPFKQTLRLELTPDGLKAELVVHMGLEKHTVAFEGTPV